MPCGDLNGQEVQKRGEMCMTDSLWYAVATNTTL